MNKKYRICKTEIDTSNFMPNDIEWIELKLLMNESRKFQPIDNSKIKNLEDWEDMDGVYISKKYKHSEFTGAIITKEHLLSNGLETPVNALWDTGSSFSAISEDMVRKLNLTPIGEGVIETSGGEVKSHIYNVHIIINEELAIPLKVNTFSGNKDIDFLIGMDVITQGRFIIKGNKNEILFKFTKSD